MLERTGSDSELVFIPYDEVYGLGIEDTLHREPAIEKIDAAIGWQPERLPGRDPRRRDRRRRDYPQRHERLQPMVVRTRPLRLSRAAARLVWLLPLGLLGTLLAFVLVGHPPPRLKVVVAGGIALIGLLALTITATTARSSSASCSMSLVWIQPGPPDVVFAVIFAVAAATGKFQLQAFR